MRVLALVVAAACSTPAPPPVSPPAGSAVTTAPVCTPVVFGVHVVDSGSPLMQKIRAYVGVEGGQSRSQSGAIQIDFDEWTADGPGRPPDRGEGLFGPSVTVDIFASAADRNALEGFFRDLAARDPEFVPPTDTKIVVEAIEGKRWRSYVVHAKPALTTAHVASARAGSREVELTLTDDGKRALYDVTGENVGRKLALVLDGTVWTAPIVTARIDGTRLSIAMPAALTPAQIDALAARFSCPP